jgi:phage shock protein A
MSILIRTYNVVRGLLGSVVSWLERRNPEALLDNERENLQRLIGQFNTGLVQFAALSGRLDAQTRRNLKQAETLEYRVKALLGSGDRDGAARAALALKQLQSQIEQDRAQRAHAEASYKTLVARRDKAVSETRSRIEQVRRQIGDLKVQRAIGDLEGMAQAMVGGLDSGGASLARLEELVVDERDLAGGRARVAALGAEVGAESETVEAAMAEAALAEFLSSQPKALAPPNQVEPAVASAPADLLRSTLDKS